jgi:hypothetical protein
MNSVERLKTTLNHRQPGRVCLDLGAILVTSVPPSGYMPAASVDGFECGGHPGKNDIPNMILLPRQSRLSENA